MDRIRSNTSEIAVSFNRLCTSVLSRSESSLRSVVVSACCVSGISSRVDWINSLICFDSGQLWICGENEILDLLAKFETG